MPIVKFLLSLLLLIAFMVASPFAVNALLGVWEEQHNPYVQPHAIHASSGEAREGLNRRLFQEIRFPSTGMRVQLEVMDIANEQITQIASSISGTLHLYSLPDKADAAPGPRPSEKAQPVLSYPFQLTPVETRSYFTEKVVSHADRQAATTALQDLEPVERYNVVYALVPAEGVAGTTAEGLALGDLHFDVSAPFEFDIEIEGKLPDGTQLGFAYSRAKRTLF